MNVGELIEKLQQLPADAPLFVDGYEGGINDLTAVDHVFVKLNVNDEGYYGPHEAFDPDDSYQGKKYGTPDCEGYAIPR